MLALLVLAVAKHVHPARVGQNHRHIALGGDVGHGIVGEEVVALRVDVYRNLSVDEVSESELPVLVGPKHEDTPVEALYESVVVTAHNL